MDLKTLSVRDIKEAMKLCVLNFGAVKPEYREDLLARLRALREESASRK